MRVVVTGGRDYRDHETIARVLSGIEITALAHGGANGADSCAHVWARKHNVPVTPFCITAEEWAMRGKAAGPIRNGIMLRTFKPDVVIAFPGNRGTNDCVKQAKQLGIRVELVR